MTRRDNLAAVLPQYGRDAAPGEGGIIVAGVLIIGLHYAPESSGNAPYTAGLASALADRGEVVRVITGTPHYPEWRAHPGFGARTTRIARDGVDVEHLRHRVPSEPTTTSRLAMELQFGLRAAARPWRRPSVVVFVSPALFSTAVVVLRAWLSRTPYVIWVQDIYSLGVVQAGGAGNATGRMMRRLEGRVLRSARRVVVIHNRFRRFLVEELGVDPARVEVVRNWSHVTPPTDVDRAAVRARMGWAEDDIVVLHAGNMGAKQGLDNVVRAAGRAHDRGSRVLFVLLGHGNQRATLERAAVGDRIRFVDPVPEDELMAVLASADVLLVNERPGLTEMSVPSKLTTYFASGRPVLAATDARSVTADEIEESGAGIRVDPAAPDALVDGAELLAADPGLGARLGEAGSRYRAERLTVDASVGAFRDLLRRMSRV